MKHALTALRTAGCLALVGVAAGGALAQPPAGAPPRDLAGDIVATLVYSLIGIVMAIVGFKLFDLVIPFNLEQEVCEKRNVAAGLLSAAVVLGICLIIALVVQ